MTDQLLGVSQEKYREVVGELQHYKQLFQNIATLGIAYQRESYTCCTTTTMTGDLMMANALPTHQKGVEAGHILIQTSARQQRLTHDFVLWVRITSGQVLLRKQRMDITPVIRNSIKGAAESPYLRKPTEITPIIEPAASGQILGDPQYLSFVIERLVENAMVYSPPNANIQIVVQEAKPHPTELPLGNYTRIVITDSGYGIPQHEQSNLFSMFYRSPSNVTKNPNGAGTSLATCQLIVKSMGGDISLTSQSASKDSPASGTTITIMLPGFPALA
jgi:signal transduction histidine kinase